MPEILKLRSRESELEGQVVAQRAIADHLVGECAALRARLAALGGGAQQATDRTIVTATVVAEDRVSAALMLQALANRVSEADSCGWVVTETFGSAVAERTGK